MRARATTIPALQEVTRKIKEQDHEASIAKTSTPKKDSSSAPGQRDASSSRESSSLGCKRPKLCDTKKEKTADVGLEAEDKSANSSPPRRKTRRQSSQNKNN